MVLSNFYLYFSFHMFVDLDGQPCLSVAGAGLHYFKFSSLVTDLGALPVFQWQVWVLAVMNFSSLVAKLYALACLSVAGMGNGYYEF